MSLRTTAAMQRLCAAALLASLAAAGCEIEPNSVMPARTPAKLAPAPVVAATPASAPVAAPDPLGPKPSLAAAKTFEPAAPTVFKAANGITVWLLERHALPLVSATLAIPVGSAADPRDKAGLAHITADMLDEGAGKRSAVEVSTAISDLGATLATGAGVDGSYVSLSVLKKNFKPAFEILSDVVARPRFEAKEWKRVSDLWKNELQKRSEEPNAVARVVMSAVLYGPGTPYGHPTSGFIADAKKIDLGAVKGFYDANFRADQAVLVVVGDITQDEITAMIGASLGAWKAPKAAAKVEALPPIAPRAGTPRLVLVDRADAPQSVIAVVREGVAASDPKAPPLDLINTALGGSFTSRLNQSLREDHGWTYGARSSFSETRAVGSFSAGAAVVTEATGAALKEMLSELEKMAAAGLSDGEIVKVKAQDRAELVQTYETLGGVSRRLATLAMLGLPPGFDATASRARQQASKEQLRALASLVGPSQATIIVVGPKAAVLPQLAEIGLPAPELRDAEGFALKPADAGPPKAAAKAAAPAKPKK